jgi:hypothetical protein
MELPGPFVSWLLHGTRFRKYLVVAKKDDLTPLRR